jgi:hypothetical protein
VLIQIAQKLYRGPQNIAKDRSGIWYNTIKVIIGSSGGEDNGAHKRQHYLDLGVKAEDSITHPDDIPPPISRLRRERTLAELDRLRAQRAAKYGFQLLGIPLGLQEFISKSVKDKFSGLYAQWKPVIRFKDTQSAWLMNSMCLSRSINHICRQIPTGYIMEHASIFREILSTKISDLDWARLKLLLDLGGAGILDIYNTARSGFVASYQECFKHIAIHFPVIKDLIHSNVLDDRRLTLTMRCFNEERSCLANKLNLLTHSPDVEREAIKLHHYFNQILIRKSVQGRRDYEANLLHTTQEESFAFLRIIPYKKPLTMNPDRFKTAFKIRFKLPLTFGANFI